MRIGGLNFKEYAAKKPVTVSTKGKYVTTKEFMKQPSLTLGSLHALERSKQIEFTLKRLSMEPDFVLGILGVGMMTKDEVIQGVKDQTEFGKQTVNAEMQYCMELMKTLKSREKARWPKTPRIEREPVKPPWKTTNKYLSIKVRSGALFCENTTDSVTSPFAAYRLENVLPVFTRRGFNVTRLSDLDDIRTNFVPVAKKRLTCYISGIGHGSYTTFTGHGGDHILEVNSYDSSEVQNKCIHFLSCRTAAQLGPNTIENGAKMYAGYDENFYFLHDDSSTSINETQLFQKCDSVFDVMMGMGFTALKAFKMAISTFNAAINQVPNTYAAALLLYDRDHFRLHGDGDAKIKPYRYVRFYRSFRNLKAEDLIARAGELED